MNYEELWIGDEVFVSSRGMNGRWEGRAGDRQARVRIGEKIFLVALSDLSEARSAEQGPPPKKISTRRKEAFVPERKHAEIDLHMEVLAPDRVHDLPEMILEYQLRKCRLFVEDCIRHHRPSALIIHGKGTGVLKAEVIHYLDGVPEVKFKFPKKDGGATEIWFSMPY